MQNCTHWLCPKYPFCWTFKHHHEWVYPFNSPIFSGVVRGGQRGACAPGATLGGCWNRPDIKKNNRPTIWCILYIVIREEFRISNSFLKKWIHILALYVLCTWMKTNWGLFFFFVFFFCFCFCFLFCLSFLKMTKICFGTTNLKVFWEKSEQGATISLLAPGARHPYYAPAHLSVYCVFIYTNLCSPVMKKIITLR